MIYFLLPCFVMFIIINQFVFSELLALEAELCLGRNCRVEFSLHLQIAVQFNKGFGYFQTALQHLHFYCSRTKSFGFSVVFKRFAAVLEPHQSSWPPAKGDSDWCHKRGLVCDSDWCHKPGIKQFSTTTSVLPGTSLHFTCTTSLGFLCWERRKLHAAFASTVF